MVSLLDIAPAEDTVELTEGKLLTIYGVSASGVAYLFKRFPELRMLISGMEVSRDRIGELAPEAISAIITCACGVPGNEKAEEIASRLSLEKQMEIIDKAMVLTMPGGVGPFVARMQQLASLVSGGGESSTKVPDSNLPLPSNASSAEATTRKMSGRTPRDE